MVTNTSLSAINWKKKALWLMTTWVDTSREYAKVLTYSYAIACDASRTYQHWKSTDEMKFDIEWFLCNAISHLKTENVVPKYKPTIEQHDDLEIVCDPIGLARLCTFCETMEPKCAIVACRRTCEEMVFRNHVPKEGDAVVLIVTSNEQLYRLERGHVKNDSETYVFEFARLN